MSKVKLVEHSPEKEFSWVAPVKMFQKNIMVWVLFLSEVLSCCTLDFPGRHIPATQLHPRSRRSPAVPAARPAPGSSLCPQPRSCWTEGSGGAVWDPMAGCGCSPLLGPLLWWLLQCINLLQPTVSCIINF